MDLAFVLRVLVGASVRCLWSKLFWQMGAVWGSPVVGRPSQATEKLDLGGAGSKRSRPASIDRTEKEDTLLVQAPALGDAQIRPVATAPHSDAPSFDATPDGNVHRFKVRCPALYWGNKKDVVKVLKRTASFPPYNSVLKVTKWDHFFINFPNAETAAAGVAQLALIQHKGDTWDATPVTGQSAKRARVEQNFELSRKEGNINEGGVCRTGADVTAPWKTVPYDQQLVRKRRSISRALSAVTNAVWNEGFARGALAWADSLRAPGNSRGQGRRSVPPCCPLDEMKGACGDLEAARDFYRNKNEFTIGFSPSSCGLEHTHHVREPTVGFSLGLVKDGEMRISAVTEDCLTTAIVARQVADVMTTLVVRSKQTLYDKISHSGYWRQVMCRHSDRTRIVIVVPMVCPTPLNSGADGDSLSAEAWDDARCREETWLALAAHFADTPYQVGLFWQVNDHISKPASEVEATHVGGVMSLEEELMGKSFRVHPAAFFQVNTLMAERLYETIGSLGDLKPSTVLLDICCGAGTIGICLSGQVARVIGVEMCESAVIDARRNASQNGINNAIFIAGKVEDKIREVLSHVPDSHECVAVLDPPRAGVHNSVSLGCLLPVYGYHIAQNKVALLTVYASRCMLL